MSRKLLSLMLAALMSLSLVMVACGGDDEAEETTSSTSSTSSSEEVEILEKSTPYPEAVSYTHLTLPTTPYV